MGKMMKKQYVTGAVALLAMAASFVCTAGDAWAALSVNVMPSGVSSPVNSWDSGPYTWPGNSLQLWGNVQYDGAGTLTYTWDFGAGEGSSSGTVTNRNSIAATHAYDSGSYIATLTVTDGTETDTDTVYIDVEPRTLEVETNLAIQRGLKYLYDNRIAYTVNGQPVFYWNGQTNSLTNTALSALAFENHGHLGRNDADQDIYAETVQKGLDYLFSYMYSQGASNVVNTYSDINNNGISLYCYTTGLYDVGITTMAIAGSASPAEIVGPAGSTAVRGKSYKEVLEDMVDFIAYAQHDSGGATGGWRYSPNGGADNSVSQWPVLALGEAERAPWSINAPAWVKTKMATWINYSQYSDGGFGYTYSSEYRNVAKTGAGIAQLAYGGYANQVLGTGTRLSKAIDFLNTYWLTNQGGYLYHYNLGYHYAMYAVKKGMDFAGQPTIGSHDWQSEYNQWYVTNQYANGTWPAAYWITHPVCNAAFGLLVMAPLEVCKPIADAGGDKEVLENQAIILDGTQSTTTCAEDDIVVYEWDCDYNGVTFVPDATAATASCSYAITNGSDTQLFTAALRVTDNQSPAKTDIDTAIITVSNGNVSPVANPGGPYSAAVGESVTLDGTGSTDANACTDPAIPTCLGDFIASYKWDLDGDGLFGSEDTAPVEPEGPTPSVNFGDFMGTKTIGLKVTDSFGRSNAQSTNVTTVALSNLYPVGYELVSSVYNRLTAKWTITWKVKIYNAGNELASQVSASLTPTSIPVGVTVKDGTVSWTDPDNVIDPGETQVSGNVDATFSYTYPRTSTGPDLTKITWDIELTDSGGTRHIIRNVVQ
jgi:hypothetical protein